MLTGSFFYYVSQDLRILESKIEAASMRSGNPHLGELQLIKVVSKTGALPEDEMFLNGRYYDIVKKVTVKDSIYCYGIEDKREEIAINNLKEHFSTDPSLSNLTTSKFSGHKISSRGIDNFYLLILSKSCNLLPGMGYLPRADRGHYSRGFTTLITPPPQLFSAFQS